MRPQIWLIFSSLLLFSFGLFMVFNTTSAEIIDRSLDANTHVPLLKQLLYGGLGVLLGIAAYQLGYTWCLQQSRSLLLGGICLLLLLFAPYVGHTVNGSRRWLGLCGYTFQPSECIKILIPAFYIHWFAGQKQEVHWRAFLKMLGFVFCPILLILIEPDNGTAGILLVLLVALFFLTRIPLRYWALPLVALSLIGGSIAYQLPYVRQRIEIYLHPELDLKGKGHQPHQAKIAAGSGKFWGRGLGESIQKLNYLPEARSDYIAAIFAEEMGFIGVLGLIATYILFTSAGVAIAFQAKDKRGFLFASILTFLIALQAFLNLGIVSGLLPSKGMTLPFFSQGGSSLVVNTLALFLLLDIARHSKKAYTRVKA